MATNLRTICRFSPQINDIGQNRLKIGSKFGLGFGAACPMAHMFARLRIADHISGIVARLTTGSGGLTLGRTGFAPAGRQTKFPEVIASSFPFDPHCLVALVCLDLSSCLEKPRDTVGESPSCF